VSSSADASRSYHVLARAKLNLLLRVLARDSSGYHQIETIFCLLELADEIAVTRGGTHIDLDVQTSSDIGPERDNLAFRAAHAFRERIHSDDGIRIRLVKHVPPGAGLGGGSSDAAAVLHALNALHGNPLGIDELIDIAATLGSDVPFFAARVPLALGRGRGDRLAALPALPVKPVLLALTGHHVATADAYAALAQQRHAQHATSAAMLHVTSLSWQDVAAMAVNDFETVVFQQLPVLGAIRTALEHSGALCARLTGSGSAVFGVFEDDSALAAARSSLAAQFPTARFVTSATAAQA
jgi:4-diphosphocytidyl-2-C-methyl-D-erythritol kinase